MTEAAAAEGERGAGAAPSPATPSSADWPLALAAAAAALACLLALWLPRHLPMADLPQHQAQLAIWLKLSEPGYRFADLYRVDLFNPYLLFYVAGRLLALVLPLWAAMRCLVTAAVLGLPLATWLLLRRTGGDPWWALACFPLAFGIAFAWGFLNYIATVPLALALLAETYPYAARPTRRRGALLGAGFVLLFFCHMIAWGLALGAACLVAASRWGLRPGDWRRWLPLAISAPLAVVWLARAFLGEPFADSATRWQLGLDRILYLPDLLIGYDAGALCALGLLLGGVVLSARRLAPGLGRRGPLALAAALFLTLPMWLGGTAHVFTRLAVFLPPLALAALVPREPGRGRRIGRALLVVAAVGWPLLLTARHLVFDREVRGFERVAARLPAGAHVLSAVVEPRFRPLVGEPLLHIPQLLQPEVRVDPSFARSFQTLVKYRPGVEALGSVDPDLAAALRTEPYDYVVARASRDDRLPQPLRGPAWRQLARSGRWRLFGRRRGASPGGR